MIPNLLSFALGAVAGAIVGIRRERVAALQRARAELRRRCDELLGGSTVTTSDDGGVW